MNKKAPFPTKNTNNVCTDITKPYFIGFNDNFAVGTFLIIRAGDVWTCIRKVAEFIYFRDLECHIGGFSYPFLDSIGFLSFQ